MPGIDHTREGRLPLSQLVAYGAPSLPMAMLLLAVYVYLPTFYAQHLGLDLAAIGAILLLTRLVDVVTDPLVGSLSDRTGGRWGRRRPWIVVGVPVTLVAVYMLFAPTAPVGNAYLLVWTLALSVGWTLIVLPLYAWGAELSDQYHERSRIAAARQILGVFGTIVVILLAALPALVDGISTAGSMEIIAWFIIGCLPVTVLALVLAVPERPSPRFADLHWRAGIALLLRNAALKRLLLCNFLNGLATGLPATLFLLFVGTVLELPDAVGILLLTYFACSILAVPAWLKVSYRIGKHRTWAASMVLACAAFPVVLFLGPGDFWPFMAMTIVTGFALGADLAFPPSMQADVVDLDTVEGGRQRAGLVFALNQMAGKLALAFAVGLAFPILGFFGFSANGPNDATALTGLVVLYGLVPVALKLAALALLRNFPIDAARQAALRVEIRRKAVEGGTAATPTDPLTTRWIASTAQQT